MAETQTFPRRKIVVDSIWYHVRCDECSEEKRSDKLHTVDRWWVMHDENHHRYYWQTAEVIDG